MRLVLVNNLLYHYGGAEKVFLDQADLFREKGHDVFIYGQTHPLNPPYEYQDWFPAPNGYVQKSFIANFPRFFRFVYSARNRRSFKKFLDEVKPDLVHAHNLYGGLTTALLDAARDAGVPVVMTLHDYKLISPSPMLLSRGKPCRDCFERPGNIRCVLRKCLEGRFLKTFSYWAETLFCLRTRKYQSVAAFISTSRFLAEKVALAGYDAARIHVVPNALDAGQYAPGKGRGRYFLYAGKITEAKGVGVLLKAFENIKAELVLAGDGRQLAAYQKMAEGRNNIRFTGNLDSGSLNGYYRDCLAVIVPSIWYENASMTVLEALAHGKPVVASRIGGLPEQVEDGANGFLFEPGDTRGLENILSRLLSEAGLVEELGRNARRIFEERYCHEVYYESLMRVYGQVLGPREG